MAAPTDARRDRVLMMHGELSRLARAPEAENDLVVRQRLTALVDHVCSSSAFWRDRLGDVRITGHSRWMDELRTLPPMTRADLQRHGQEMRILLPGTRPADYALFTTSGSTGEPRQVVRHRETAARLAEALTLLEWTWHDRDFHAPIAAFRVNHDDENDVPARAPLTYVGSTARTTTRGSTYRTPGELLDELASIRPRYLFCNGLMVRLMAAEQLHRPRHIVDLEQVMSVSDRVDPAMRQLVRDAFGARVCDRYSTEEFGIIALECPADEHMHVIAPRFVVETVDDQGDPCAAGEPGRVLVTSLVEHVQPFIRYEIGDIGVLGGECSAGISWPILAEIQGRTRQLIERDDGSTVLVTLIGSSLLEMRNLLDFHLVRYRDAFVVQVRTASPLTDTERDDIEHEVHRVFREVRPVHIVEVHDPSALRTWKRHEFDDVDEPYRP